MILRFESYSSTVSETRAKDQTGVCFRNASGKVCLEGYINLAGRTSLTNSVLNC